MSEILECHSFMPVDCIKEKEKIQEKQIENCNYLADQTINTEKLEFQQHKRDGESNLMSSADHSNSEDLETVKETKTLGSKNRRMQGKVKMPISESMHNVHPSRTSVLRILTDSYLSLLLSASNSMTIKVKRDDLTRIRDVEVVVSCTNHHLDINGPLADQIIKAAGPSVATELIRHENLLAFLQTGDLVHTSAGNLKGFKAIIHVVGPQVLPDNEQTSKDTLRNIFTNCLRYANDNLKLKSICLPPIGLGKQTHDIATKYYSRLTDL